MYDSGYEQQTDGQIDGRTLKIPLNGSNSYFKPNGRAISDSFFLIIQYRL